MQASSTRVRARPDSPSAPTPAEPSQAERRAAYDQWRAEAFIPKVFEVSADPARFYGRLDFRGVGSVAALSYEMSPARYVRSPSQARRDGIDMIWVQLVSSGGFTGTSPGRSTTAGPRAAALCDFSVSVEQHSHASSGSALMIPREAFGQIDPRTLHGAAVTGGRCELLHDYVRWLGASAARARVSDPDATARAIGQVTAACFGAPAALSADVSAGLGPVALQRARAFIAASLADPDLRAADIARAAGVSRATLYRLCTPLGGVAELVWSLRLEAVRQALTDPDRPGRLAPIAESCGFTSPQHFSRRFRQTYGFSPRNLRPF